MIDNIFAKIILSLFGGFGLLGIIIIAVIIFDKLFEIDIGIIFIFGMFFSFFMFLFMVL